MINLEPIDLNQPINKEPIFQVSQFTMETVVGSVNLLTLSMLLYPLDRVQQIKQIQQTYSSESIKFENNIYTRCSHFGFRSIFRGLKVTLIKNSMLYSLYEFINKFQYKQNKLAENIAKALVGSAGYIIIYPLENLKLRMAADLQEERYYSNIRDCIKKIKKHEGQRAFYRGFTVASVHFLSQYFLIKTLIQQYKKLSKELKNPTLFAGLFFTSFAAYETVLYPLDTLKKNIQINGSLGHDDYNQSIRKTMKTMNFTNYFSGFPVRLANSACYVLLSMILGRIVSNMLSQQSILKDKKNIVDLQS